MGNLWSVFTQDVLSRNFENLKLKKFYQVRLAFQVSYEDFLDRSQMLFNVVFEKIKEMSLLIFWCDKQSVPNLLICVLRQVRLCPTLDRLTSLISKRKWRKWTNLDIRLRCFFFVWFLIKKWSSCQELHNVTYNHKQRSRQLQNDWKVIASKLLWYQEHNSVKRCTWRHSSIYTNQKIRHNLLVTSKFQKL